MLLIIIVALVVDVVIVVIVVAVLVVDVVIFDSWYSSRFSHDLNEVFIRPLVCLQFSRRFLERIRAAL